MYIKNLKRGAVQLNDIPFGSSLSPLVRNRKQALDTFNFTIFSAIGKPTNFCILIPF